MISTHLLSVLHSLCCILILLWRTDWTQVIHQLLTIQWINWIKLLNSPHNQQFNSTLKAMQVKLQNQNTPWYLKIIISYLFISSRLPYLHYVAVTKHVEHKPQWHLIYSQYIQYKNTIFDSSNCETVPTVSKQHPYIFTIYWHIRYLKKN